MVLAEHLVISTKSLSPSIRYWLGRALGSGWFRLAAGSYDGGPRGAMCPIAAAATMAGVWHDGAILEGNPEWGTREAPSEPVEDFAAYFDLCAADVGLKRAIELVHDALASPVNREKHAA